MDRAELAAITPILVMRSEICTCGSNDVTILGHETKSGGSK